jgi:PhoPQ-activated pathogenicity-related protein
MDAIQEFLRTSDGDSLRVNPFFVAGASKRGWTALGSSPKPIAASWP